MEIALPENKYSMFTTFNVRYAELRNFTSNLYAYDSPCMI